MAEDKNIRKTLSEFDSWQETAKPPNELNLGRTTQNRWRNFCKMSPTEEMSAAVQDDRDDTTTCCICDETYRDPKILPCAHTFCLNCLQHIGTYTDKNPGGQMPCPLCSQEFTIPVEGFTALKKNVAMIKLIDITATQHRCSSVGECSRHKHESISLYCTDCNEALCVVCLLECHKNHGLSDLNKAADIMNSELQRNVSAAKECMSDAMKKKEKLFGKGCEVRETIKRLETEVDQIRQDLKALIDQHADSLLKELDLLKKERFEDIEEEESELDKHIDCLRKFEIRCAELSADGRRDNLFCKKVKELKEQLAELQLVNKVMVERQLCSFEVYFTKTVPTLSETYTETNMIGVIKANTDYRSQPELITAIGICCSTDNEGDEISGMTVVNNNVFIAYTKTPVVSIYDSGTNKRKRQMTLKGLVHDQDVKHCINVDENVYITSLHTKEILRIDKNLVCTKWTNNIDCSRLSASKDSTLVATCFDKQALREYSLQGTLLREIELCPTIIHPLHAIKLGNGQFVVSHGTFRDTICRVCMINDNGVITKSFGGFRGSSNHQLDFPTCLAVDESGNIFVLDKHNNRALLLSPTLEFKMELLTKNDGLRRPMAMHLDQKTRRLFIADNNWTNFCGIDCKVLVFNISTVHSHCLWADSFRVDFHA